MHMNPMSATFDLTRHLQTRKLEQVVENRTAYTIDTAELNIYETHQYAEKVELTFNSPVLASMIRGKKVMHLPNTPSFEFLPGESVIMPANETMCIDFPEARMQNPTQCLALAIAPDKVKQLTDYLNDKAPLIDQKKGWQFDESNFYLTNDSTINQLIARLIQIFTENNTAKDVFANLVMQELVIRLMQTKARQMLLMNYHPYVNTNRLAHVAKYIQDRLHEQMTVRELADQACMSEPNFFRCFKQQFGLTPIEYINNQRIQQAMRLLKTSNQCLADVCFVCGFNNVTYFLKLFKKTTGITPAQFRKTYRQLQLG